MSQPASRLRSDRRRRSALPLLAGMLAALAACSESAEERERARAELEAEFGRRSEAAPEASPPAAGPEAGAGAAREGDGEPDAEPDPVVPGGAPPAPTPAPPGAPPPPAPAAGDRPEEAVRETPPPGRRAAGPVDVDSLLAEAERAYTALPSLRAAFVQRVEVPLLERTAEGHGTWYQRGRDRFRMDFDEPPDDVFVADGTHLWLYQPSQEPDQVIRTTLASGTVETGTADLLGRILSEARTGYDGTHEGVEEVAGAAVHHLALTPRGPSDFRAVDVWIGDSDALVRRFRIEETNETIRTVTLSRLEPGVALADSLFRFTMPPGATLFDPGGSEP